MFGLFLCFPSDVTSCKFTFQCYESRVRSLTLDREKIYSHCRQTYFWLVSFSSNFILKELLFFCGGDEILLREMCDGRKAWAYWREMPTLRHWGVGGPSLPAKQWAPTSTQASFPRFFSWFFLDFFLKISDFFWKWWISSWIFCRPGSMLGVKQ